MTTCAEIRELLADAASGRLDGAGVAEVEAHCARCAACASEMNSLREYYRALGEVGEVRAPVDFLLRVRERIERRSSWGRIIDAIFIPVKTKLPLELAGVAATAIFLVAVFHLVRPAAVVERRTARAPEGGAAVREAAPREAAPTVGEQVIRQEAVVAEAPKEEASRAAEPAREEISEDRVEPAMVDAAEPAGLRQQAKAVRAPAALFAKAPAREEESVIEIALLVPPRELGYAAASVSEEKVDRAGVAVAKAKGDLAPRGRKAEKKKAVSSDRREAETMEEEAPAAAEAGGAAESVRSCVESAGGTILRTDRDAATGRITAVVAELPSRAYPALLTALARAGELRGAPPSVPPAETGTLRVRILFVRPR